MDYEYGKVVEFDRNLSKGTILSTNHETIHFYKVSTKLQHTLCVGNIVRYKRDAIGTTMKILCTSLIRYSQIHFIYSDDLSKVIVIPTPLVKRIEYDKETNLITLYTSMITEECADGIYKFYITDQSMTANTNSEIPIIFKKSIDDYYNKIYTNYISAPTLKEVYTKLYKMVDNNYTWIFSENEFVDTLLLHSEINNFENSFFINYIIYLLYKKRNTLSRNEFRKEIISYIKQRTEKLDKAKRNGFLNSCNLEIDVYYNTITDNNYYKGVKELRASILDKLNQQFKLNKEQAKETDSENFNEKVKKVEKAKRSKKESRVDPKIPYRFGKILRLNKNQNAGTILNTDNNQVEFKLSNAPIEVIDKLCLGAIVKYKALSNVQGPLIKIIDNPLYNKYIIFTDIVTNKLIKFPIKNICSILYNSTNNYITLCLNNKKTYSTYITDNKKYIHCSSGKLDYKYVKSISAFKMWLNKTFMSAPNMAVINNLIDRNKKTKKFKKN